MPDTEKVVKIGNIKNLSIYVVIFLFFLVFLYLFEVVIPFGIAFIIAYLVNPIKKYLDRYLNKTISSLFSIMFFIICLLSILILISPILIQQTQNFISNLPSYINKVQSLVNELNDQFLINEKIKNFDYINFLKPFTENLIYSTNSIINNSIEFFNSLVNFILIFVISFYMSLEFKKVQVFFDDLNKKSNLKNISNLIKEIDIVLSKFIRGQSLICLILSSFYSVTLFSIGIEFGLILGVFAGIMSFIPYIGALLGGGLTLILGFFQFGLSIELLFLFVVFISGQLLESYYLTPKFVGDAIGLNPIWILFALLSGAHLAGFIGILISLPFAAVLGVIIKHYFIKIININ